MRVSIVGLTLLLVSGLSAHELIVEAEYQGRVALVDVRYYDKAPAKDSDVTVWAPDGGDDSFVAGRTDRNGAFAFVPDQPGTWRIVADDGRGHREALDLTVTGLGASPESGPPVRRGPFERALTGVSVIFGLTGLWMWRRSRGLGDRNTAS